MNKYILLALTIITMMACGNNNVPKDLKIGDWYNADGTFGVQAGVRRVGIVVRVPTDNLCGLVVCMDEPEENWNGGNNEEGCLVWSTDLENNDANEWGYGYMNMEEVMEEDPNFDRHPAMAWVHAKNPAGTTYEDNSRGIWYLPSGTELKALYDAVPLINDMFGYGQMAFTTDVETYYWSSSEYGNSDDLVWALNFNDGTEANKNKVRKCRVRAVLAF